MKPTEFIDRCVLAGVPLDMALKAAKVFEEGVELVLDVRRSKERERTQRYRERGGGKIPPEIRNAVFERDGFACVYCGSEDHLHCDHDTPVSRGGESTMENLVTACRVCNARKKDRDRKAYERQLSKDNPRKSSDSCGRSEEKVSPTPLSKTNPSDEGYITTREADFSTFWAAYPRKVGKGAARKAYFAALRKTGADPPTLSAALVAAKALGFGSNPQFTPHAATWLQQERWLDEPEPVRPRLIHERPDPHQRKRDQLETNFTGFEIAARRRALERAGGS